MSNHQRHNDTEGDVINILDCVTLCVVVSLWLLDRFAPNLLPAAFARKRLFDALLLARLQIEGVLLDFLDAVFLLYLSLEPSQCVFDGLAILNSNLSQTIHPPSGCNRFSIITYFGGYGDVSIVHNRIS